MQRVRALSPVKVGVLLFFIIVAATIFMRATPKPLPYDFMYEFFPTGFDNLAICHDHRFLLGVDSGRDIVAGIDLPTDKVDFVLGEDRKSGNDNDHFNKPFGILCDEERKRILVSDTGNKRIQIFGIADQKFVQSVPTPEAYATIVLDARHDHIFAIVTDEASPAPPGRQIRVLDANTLAPVGNPLTINWQEGDEHERAMYAYDMAVDEAGNRLFVSDYGNARFDVFDLNTLASKGIAGITDGNYEYGLRTRVPNQLAGIAYDDMSGHLLVADDKSLNRIQLFKDKFVGSLKDDQIAAPEKMVTYEGHVFVVDTDPQTGKRHVVLFADRAIKVLDNSPGIKKGIAGGGRTLFPIHPTTIKKPVQKFVPDKL